MMLEDRYRDHGVGGFSVPVMNGYVRGTPKLVIDGERRAFAFDGKTQHLELNARAADMGQITVDMAVRPAGGAQQTLWDFGSDADNCMTLKTNASGTPVFTATVAGKEVVTLPMTAPLAKGVWTRLRVEIDGEQIALWANDRLSAKKASTFRPADVFPSGRQKRNFVAASRGGKEHFAGAIDYVVIYHRVHGKALAELPPPVIDASRRPTQRFATELIKDRAARKRYEIENNRTAGEAGVYYSKLAEDIVIRLHELRNRDPNWQKAIAKAKEDLANIGKPVKQPKQAEPQKEIAPPPQLPKLRKQREALQQKLASYAEKEKLHREGEAEWLKTIKDPKYLELKAEQQKGREQLEKLRKEVEASFEVMPEEVATKKKIAELTAQRAKLDDVVKQVNKAVAEAVAKMPVYWDTKKIEAENRFLREMRVQYEGEHGGGGGGAIQGYRSQRERRKHMARNPSYKQAIEIDRELEVLKTLSPIHREMHFAGAKEYNALRSKLQGKDSPGHRANEILARLKEERRQRILGSEYDQLRKQREALDREIGSLQRQYDQKRRQRDGAARRQRDGAARRQQELRREEIRKELFQAYDKAVEPYYLEYHVGVSYLRSAMRGFYNTPYSHHLRAQGLAKKTYRYRDEPGGTMQTAIESYRPENWKTDVRAWDWRTRWERDGTISQYPMTQQWLKRVRGDGPINVVD